MTKFLNNADIKGYIAQTAVTSYLLKADSTGRLVAAIAGTDYQAPTTALLPSGGTAGQILAKIDGTNYNTQWIDNFAQQIKYDVKLGAALSKGTPVYVSSANGTNIIVSASSNNTEATSSKTLGLLETGGALNDIVKVVSDGLLSGLNTSAATIGDPVWLGVNGALIFGLANKPSAPAHLVYIGAVTRVHAVNGEIFIKVQNGFELDELHNVALSSVADGQGLFYESATSLWKNKTIASVLGYTPANDSTVVHLAGTETITGVKTFSSVINASTLSLNGGTLAGNNIVSMRSNPTGGQFRIEKSDGSLSAYPFYIGVDGTALAYYYNAAGALKVLLHTDGTSYFGNSLSVGYSTYAATSYSLDVNGSAQITSTLQVGGNLYGVGATFSNAVTAASIIRSGGTSSQFLKADGSVDSNAYITSSSLSAYLPLTGGTLTGDLTISGTNPRLYFTDTDNNPDYFISNTDGTFTVYDVTNSVGRFKIYSGGNAEFSANIFINGDQKFQINGYNSATAFITSNVGYNSNYNGVGIYSNPTNANSLPAWYLDLGGLDGVTNNPDAFSILRKPSGGSLTKLLAVLSSGQLRLNTYTTSTSFSGTAAGYLAFDSSGNVITVAGVAATDNTKLPLAGGTMTGALVVSAADRGFEVNASGGISLYSNEINAGALGGTGTIYLGWRRTSQINVGVPISSNSTIAATGAISTTVSASAWGFLATTSGYSNGSGIWFSTNVGELLLRKADGTLSTRISADGTYAYINNNNIIHAGNIGSQSVTYATNSTRLYASDSPYTYGGAAPYYLYMNYDGGSYWELKVSPATPGTVRVAYANSAGSASSASTSSQVTINYNNDSNSTYQLLWGSGNNVYGTSQVYVNPSSDVIYARGGYVSPGNPWGTSDSAYFPNGITTAGGQNWIYGATFIGNAPSNGSGVLINSNGSSYFRSNVGTNSHGSSARFHEIQSAAGNFIPYSFESEYGNHSWGTVLRIRINQVGADRPSMQFSYAGTDNRWNVGYCYPDDNFRITQNMAYRNDNSTSDGWGTERFRINTDGNTYAAIGGTLYANGNLVWHASNAPRAGNSNLMYYAGFTLDANTMPSNSTGFTYSVNAPYTGPIAKFSEDGYPLQINATYSGGVNIAYRTRNGDAGSWNSWYAFITTANIGSQTVANTTSISSAVGGSYNWTGVNYFKSNLGGYCGSLSNPSLQANSDSNNSAFLSFHKGGYYAVNMGLDADNVLRIGGWSAAANRWQLDMSGNQTVAGSMYASYFYGSGSIRCGDMWGGAGLYRPSGDMVFGTEGYNWVFSSQANTRAYFASGDGNLWMQWSGEWLSTTLGRKHQDGANPSYGAVYADNWFRAYGDCGLYSQSYGGHLRRSNGSSFGNWETFGYERNGWSGFCYVHNYLLNIMSNTSGDHGFYQENGNGWTLFYNRGNNCWGIGTDNTYSGDGFRCIKYGSAQYGWTTWSDRRAKENITPVTGALNKVLAMQGVYYNYIKDEAKSQHVGFIAQDLMEVLPQSVRYAEEIDEYNINYGPITSVLAEATKEQNDMIVSQAARIEQLELLVQQLINSNNGISN